MKLSNEVTLSLSDEDMKELVAQALVDNLVSTYDCDSELTVEDIDFSDDGLWEIKFVLKEKTK